MTIERTDDAIIVTLAIDTNIDEIQRFLNYLRFKELTAQSQATQADADELAKSVNKSWWAKNKQKFYPTHENHFG